MSTSWEVDTFRNETMAGVSSRFTAEMKEDILQMPTFVVNALCCQRICISNVIIHFNLRE